MLLRRGALAASALALMLAGCIVASSATETTSSAPPAVLTRTKSGGVTTLTEKLTLQGLKRSYLLVRPTKIPRGRALPVVVVLHGINATPAIEEKRTGFLPLALDGMAILVYPAGYKEAWNAGSCCRNPGAPPGVNDVAFVDDVVHEVLATQPANPSQVYLTGYSDGGRMAYRIACSEPTLYAGFAAGEAVAVGSCLSKKPESFALVDSTSDPEVAYDPSDPPKVVNGFAELPATAQIGRFVALDRCTGNPVTSVAGKMRIEEWRTCADGKHVELATLLGGNHGWPYGANGSPSAEELMWTFWTGQPFP